MGIGSIFSSLFRTLSPLAKTATKVASKSVRQAAKSNLTKKVKKDLSNAALNVVADTISGEVSI